MTEGGNAWSWLCSQPESTLTDTSHLPSGDQHRPITEPPSALPHSSNSKKLCRTRFYITASHFFVTTLNHNKKKSEDAGFTYPQLVSRRLSPTWREAMPKSAILMLFFSSSNRFSGFRSLWLKNSETKKKCENEISSRVRLYQWEENGNHVISEHPPPPWNTQPSPGARSCNKGLSCR